MKRLTGLVQAVAALGAMSLAGSALAADTIMLDDFVHGLAYRSTYTSTVTPSVSTSPLFAGEVKGTLNSASFQTFCAEVTDWSAGWNPNYGDDYSLVSGASQFGAAKATDLNKLFTNWYSSATTAATSTAFQLALWEIIYETGTYDVSNGSFTAKSPGTATAAIYTDANNMLANLGTLGSTYMQVDVYKSAEYQDFTAVSTVPEPESYALALAALGVLVGARQFKRRGGKPAAAAA